MLSLEAQKQKSPQTVDVIEELLWTERTKKKEFYLDVKRSLLNLLEFSKTKLDLDSIREIYYMVADITCFGKYFENAEKFKIKNFVIYERDDIPKHLVLRVRKLNQLACHHL